MNNNVASSIIIGGATASGKTALAINLANKLRYKYGIDAEIVNADSVQMYSDLKILTAYPSDDELHRVKHNLFGILDPYGSSSVSSWLDLAQKEIKRIHHDKKIAIVCGGTGFYIRALLNGVADIPQIPDSVREYVQNHFKELGRDQFFEKLSKLDPISAQKLHKNDTQRILRAYEVVLYTGKSLSEWWEASKNKKNVENVKNNAENKEKNEDNEKNMETITTTLVPITLIPTIILHPEKEKIRERARIRIQKMIEQGAIEEVNEFNKKYPNYDGALREVIGYREISEFLQNLQHNKKNNKNEFTHDKSKLIENKLIEKMCVRTNQYIKRQSTWFRNQLKNAKFINEFGDKSDILEEVFEYLTKCIYRPIINCNGQKTAE